MDDWPRFVFALPQGLRFSRLPADFQPFGCADGITQDFQQVFGGLAVGAQHAQGVFLDVEIGVAHRFHLQRILHVLQFGFGDAAEEGVRVFVV